MSDIRDSCTDIVFTTPPINQASYNPCNSTVSVHTRYCQKQYNLKHLLTPHPFDFVSRSSFLQDLLSRQKVFKLTHAWSLAILLSKLRLWSKEAKINHTKKTTWEVLSGAMSNIYLLRVRSGGSSMLRVIYTGCSWWTWGQRISQ